MSTRGLGSVMRGLQKNDHQSSAQSIKIASIGEKSPNFAALVYFTTKGFPLCQAEEISMQEALLQQQEVGSTDIHH